ncbi:MAG: bifunctional nuclease family protein [Flavobacteriales bacterium]|nr:bifunctional nuclease family protein [Flavobacteriales bacterium]
MEKVELEVVGLTSGHSQKSSYTLILGEVDGQTKLPIVIGAFEAQAIALYLEKIKPQRPLTHDLFTSFAQSFRIKVKEVLINDLVEGIFYSRIVCQSNGETVEIDARTSDAVALAIRFGCPIFTRKDILLNAGIELEDEIPDNPEQVDEDIMARISHSQDFSDLSMEELKELLDEAIQVEDYDRAAQIRDEINRRS